MICMALFFFVQTHKVFHPAHDIKLNILILMFVFQLCAEVCKGSRANFFLPNEIVFMGELDRDAGGLTGCCSSQGGM